MIRIFIVDDHKIFREGLKMILNEEVDLRVTGEAEDGDSGLRGLLHQEWDVALLDVSLPGRGALEILEQVQRHKPGQPVLILTMHDDELLAMRFLKAGAMGFLTKDCDPMALMQAIRKAVGGRRHVSPDLAERMLDVWRTDVDTPPHTLLSDREFTVLLRMASGRTISQIAEELAISPRTASTYRTRILRKLNLNTNAELTHYAFKYQLVS